MELFIMENVLLGLSIAYALYVIYDNLFDD